MSAHTAPAPTVPAPQEEPIVLSLPEAPVRVFGKTTIQFEGQPLEMGPPRRRAVLALLVIGAGTVVSIPTMLEGLWGSDLPDRAVTTLQSYVSRLRQLIVHRPLADGSKLALQYRSHGYLLDVAPENIDAVRFEQLVARGLAAERHGDPARAFGLLSASLRQWTAPPFEDLSEYDFACQEAGRLSQLRLSAVEGRAEAALRLGRYDEILHDLEREAALHPTRERLIRLLMQAQYRGGRQADALQVFDRTRRYLSTELGVDVGPELRHTHEEILRQAPSLAPVHTPPLPAVPAQRPAPVPQPPAGRDGASGLPFVGRRRELAVLRAAVDRACAGQGKVVALLGESGVGKTTLLRELRRDLAEREVDVLTVNCPKADALPTHWPWKQVVRAADERWPQTLRALPADVLATFGALLPGWEREAPAASGPPAGSPGDFDVQEAVARALLALGRRPLVLVLEDLHWADAASLRLLGFLASQLADSRLLLVVTSRTFRASTNPEMRALLAALRELPVSDEIVLDGLPPQESGQLARATGLPLSDAVVGTLYRRTRGNPYFLVELLKQLTPETSAAALDSLLPDTLEEVVLERLTMLPEPVNDVLRACTVLGEECTAPVLGRVVGDGFDVGTSSAIQQAVRGGLLTSTRSGGKRLEFVHPLLWDTVRRTLSHAERGELHRRAVQALLDGAHSADVRGKVGVHARAALRSAPPEQVLRPVIEEVEKSMRLGRYDVGLGWLDLLADMLRTPDCDRRYAQAQLDVETRRLDLLHIVQKQTPRSRDALRDVVSQLGCHLGLPQTRVILSSLLSDQLTHADLSAAQTTASQLLVLARQEQDPYLEFIARSGQGSVHYSRGELDAARSLFDAALSVYDGAPQPGVTSLSLYLRGRLRMVLTAWLQGRPGDAWKAVDDIRRLAPCWEAVPWTMSITHTVEAVLRVFEDDPRDARRGALAAVKLVHRQWMPHWQWLINAVLVWANARLGKAGPADFAAARGSLTRAELTGSREVTLGLALVSDAERVAGRPREAHAYLRRLRRLAGHTGEVVYLNLLPPHLLPWRALPHVA